VRQFAPKPFLQHPNHQRRLGPDEHARDLNDPVLAGFTAHLVAKLKDARWFQAFGRFAAAAAVGLLGVTLLALARSVVDIHWALLLGSAVVFVAELRGAHPIILIVAAALLGAAWPIIDGALAGLYSL
jgi:chromate transport protein ChrA